MNTRTAILIISFFTVVARTNQQSITVYKESCSNIQNLNDDTYRNLTQEMEKLTDAQIQVENFKCKDPLLVTRKACGLLRENKIGSTLFHVTCDTGRYLRSLFKAVRLEHHQFQFESGCLNTAIGQEDSIRSRLTDVAEFFLDLMKQWGWQKVVVFTDTQIVTLLKEMSTRFTSVALVKAHNPEYITKYLTNEKSHQNYVNHFYVLCNPTNTRTVLKAANEAGLLTEPQTWVVMSDVSKDELFENFPLPYNSYIMLATTTTFTPSQEQEAAALLYSPAKTVVDEKLVSSLCSHFDPQGRKKTTDDTGKQTEISTDRSTLILDLLEVYSVEDGPVKHSKFASWLSNGEPKLSFTKPFPNMLRELSGLNIKVVTIEAPPYIILDNKKDPTPKDLKGFYGDIFNALSYEMKFNYTITIARDGLYGTKGSGQWNGMMKSLADGTANIILGDLSVTSDRKEIARFSPVLSSASLRIMYKKPDDKFYYKLYIIPFGWEIWLLVTCSIVISGALLHLSNRMSPNSARFTAKDDELVKVKDEFSLADCFFAIYNGFVQQGSEIDPREVSGKIIFVTTYLSFVIIFSSYTSIFTSFLTIKDGKKAFETLSEVLKDKSYQIGVVKATSQLEMLQTAGAREEALRQTWLKMKTDDKNFVDSIQAGLDRAYSSKFVFLTPKESTSYYLRNNCSFEYSNDEIYRDTFHMAYAKSFIYYESFNDYIDRMVESGIMQRINKKYQRDQILFCDAGDTVQSLGFKRVVSLFLLLAGASLFAAAVLGVEWIIKPARRNTFGSNLQMIRARPSGRPIEIPEVGFKTSNYNAQTVQKFRGDTFATKHYYYS